jgi:hypothetical protein
MISGKCIIPFNTIKHLLVKETQSAEKSQKAN